MTYVFFDIKMTYFLFGLMDKTNQNNFLLILTNSILLLNLRMSLVEKMSRFLDVDVRFLIGQIITDFHIKATDRLQYLHCTSSHPHHTKRSIVSSQALRVSQIVVENAVTWGNFHPKLEKTNKQKKTPWKKFLCFF